MAVDQCFSWFVFFYKQKTAYEMRISDWSSDVCSSDLQMRIIADEGAAAGRPETLDRVYGDRADVTLHRHHCLGRKMRVDERANRLVLGRVQHRGQDPQRLTRRFGNQHHLRREMDMVGVDMMNIFSLRRYPVPLIMRRPDQRPEERRVGKGGVSTCRSRWSTTH